jgi:hypothetical protein
LAVVVVALASGTQSIVSARTPSHSSHGLVEKGTCSFRGKKLYGKIQIVAEHGDVTVQEVAAFPDLKMKQVRAYADRCGLWQVVKSGADTKVQFVPAFADVRIQRVSAFPGLP